MRKSISKSVSAGLFALALTSSCSLVGNDDEDSHCSGGSVKIGTQTWQKCNLDVVPSTGTHKCYKNDQANCAKYGRLYDWATAMNLPSSCNSSTCTSQVGAKHRGICPSGWHIPSNADWDKLYRTVDGSTDTDSPYSSSTAGTKLKARSGWNRGGNGEDSYGFSALPGGVLDGDGNFDGVGYAGDWWSSTESGSNEAYDRGMYYGSGEARWFNSGKSNLLSVRCVQD